MYSSDMRARIRVADILPVACAVGAGLVAVFLSSNYAQHFPLREGPLPFRYPHAAIAAFIATGVFLMVAVVVRSDLFWPLLVGTAVITGGMFVLGFPIFDEWLAGCLTLGAAAAVVRGSVPRRAGNLPQWWVWLFIGLSLYFIAEGVRGLLLYHNLKAVRPILDAVIICSVGALLARYEFPWPPGRRITLLLAASGAAYLALYLLHGAVFHRLVFGYRVLEGIGGAERAYATFPLAVAVPAAILLLRFDRGWRRLLGLLAIVLATEVSLLSGSRAAILATTIFFAAASLRGGWRLAAQLWLSFALAYAVVVVAFHYDPMFLWYRAESMLDGLHLQRGSLNVVVFRGAAGGRKAAVARADTNRHILNEAAVFAFRSDARVFLVGAGAYGYWPSAGRFVRELRAEHGAPVTTVNPASTLGRAPAEPPRPPAWPVFLVETGVVGVLLILVNVFAALWHALVRRSPSVLRFSLHLGPVMMATALLALLGWGYFAELQTKMLLYLMFMPYGVLHAWTSLEHAESSRLKVIEAIRVPETAAVS